MMNPSERIDQLCKPPGSLGKLEIVAADLCRIQNTLSPTCSPRRLVVFAADHGVTCEGVSAWPSEVTGQVVRVMTSGRTASGVFAKQLHCQYEVVDIGLLQPMVPGDPDNGFIDAAARRGTANLRVEAAMNETDFDHAWAVGVSRADAAADAGAKLVIGGEMGIGNTTSAACLVCKFTGIDASDAVGPGAGLDASALDNKTQVVRDAVRRIKSTDDPKRIGWELGGLEIVALAGFYVRSSQRGMTVLLDGYIATAAALLASALEPSATSMMLAGHRSTEPGHQAALNHLRLSPILDLGMRLGEGSGALAALPLLDLAAAMIHDMATLDELR